MRGSELAAVEIYNLALSVRNRNRLHTVHSASFLRMGTRPSGITSQPSNRKSMQCCAVLLCQCHEVAIPSSIVATLSGSDVRARQLVH